MEMNLQPLRQHLKNHKQDIKSEISKYLFESIILIDPTLNPDGRDRHTNCIHTKGHHLLTILKMLT